MRFLDYVFTLLIAHILVSGCKYYYVKRLDKGGTPKEFSPAVDRIISCLALLPMILDAFYTYTVGLFDHFMFDRVCQKGVCAEDDLNRLKDENSAQAQLLKSHQEYEDYLIWFYTNVTDKNLSPDSFLEWNRWHSMFSER